MKSMRRRLLVLVTMLLAGVVGAMPVSAQGRCMLTLGSPACNTADIPPIFESTGWKTVALDQVTFRVADYKKEAAFYIAVMGWTLQSDDGTRAVLDLGQWGSVIVTQAAPGSMDAPAAGGGRGGPVHAVVESFGFAIDPWDAKKVEAELRNRGLSPVADHDGKGFESFHVKDPDGFDLQISNGNGHAKNRRTSSTATLSEPAPFAATGWKTVWLDHFSFGATNYKKSVSFYVSLLGWKPTYDEGSQNELMMGDVGDIIIRGGNPLDPAFGQGNRRAGGSIDHISWGISPWDTDGVVADLEKRGLTHSIDTSDGMEIHAAMFKSYHTTTPNGYNLQISYNTHDTRLNLAVAVNPRRPGNK